MITCRITVRKQASKGQALSSASNMLTSIKVQDASRRITSQHLPRWWVELVSCPCYESAETRHLCFIRPVPISRLSSPPSFHTVYHALFLGGFMFRRTLLKRIHRHVKLGFLQCSPGLAGIVLGGNEDQPAHGRAST